MFRSAILLSLATLALAAANGDLSITLKAASSSVSSVDDIALTAVITNPTKADIRVISKNNILDSTTTSSFKVTKGDDSVLFTGVRATFDLTKDTSYVTIPAGKSIAINHTAIGPLYDFETHGTGKFTFTPKSLFQTSPTDLPFSADVHPVDIEITKDVKKREMPYIVKRSADLTYPTCSDGNRKNILANSLSDARARAGGAATDINSHPNGPEFSRYFGGNKQSDIWYNFDRIAGDLSSSGTRNLYCTGDPANLCGPNSGVIAYTLVVTSGGQIVGSDIYMCEIFFTSVGETGDICRIRNYDSTTVSKGGVVLHELSHATAGTDDITYGCPACASLGAADKKNNADNYRCMALNIFLDYNC